MAKKKEQLDYLMFIDTNILLDFYRIKKSNVSIKYLEEINKHPDLIITSSQVEMEFKKNRQSVILESISEIKKIGNETISVPAILSKAEAIEIIQRNYKEIQCEQKQLKERIENILKNPDEYDPVYKSLKKLFKQKSEINLNRENKMRFKIRNLAKKRFILGYPPRKKSDNSIGDAVNWEWIINCADQTCKNIILVTRDSDFGCTYENDSYLNDWLLQEFKQRIKPEREIILTDKLSRAFKLVDIDVSKEMIEGENEVINTDLKQFPFYSQYVITSDLNETSDSLNLRIKQLEKELIEKQKN